MINSRWILAIYS